MDNSRHWLIDIEAVAQSDAVDGLVLVAGYARDERPPEEVAMIEKAEAYKAHSVFFEAGRNDRPPVAQAFIFVSDGSDDTEFAKLHKRLWSWGGVPLVYRKKPGLIQLFRCAHKPDFASPEGPVCKPVETLKIAADINSDDAWWDASRLYNGTLWDDPTVCEKMLSAGKAAHKRLFNAIKELNTDLNNKSLLKRHLRRKLLILSLLITYLEERGVFPQDYFSQFKRGATKFFHVLPDGRALVKLLDALEKRFNGHVFILNEDDRQALKTSNTLDSYARLVEGKEDVGGQLNFWKLYSFKDLPVELISHIYQLFVKNSDSSIYTPPFLVRLMLEEALSWKRLDRLIKNKEIILDPSCGSGVFLVEAYKRLVLHWRSGHNWELPRTDTLRNLLTKVHGIDLEEGAVELAAFSLCLALCDALEPEEIRKSIRLFKPLVGETLHLSCFFEAKERGLIKKPIGVVVGNPPFVSKLNTPGAKESYRNYKRTCGTLPDKQLAFLFLHEAMEMVAEGGVLSMLQPHSFLYNQQSLGFRRKFMQSWDVREILDFISVRGLFKKGDADTKVIVIVANATKPPKNRKILHATFRRTGRIDAEQGFDIDYYDLHWLPRQLALNNDGVWRADLLGGGRVLSFVDRLKKFRTLGQYASAQGWDFGEGFIEGRRNIDRPADHIVGKPLLPSKALTENGIDDSAITIAPDRPIEGNRSIKRFSPPMLLVKEHMNIPHVVWSKSYLTYKSEIVGFSADEKHLKLVSDVDKWITTESKSLQAFVAGVSVRLFTRRATALSAADIFSLPYPESGTLDMSANEQIIVEDITGYYRDLIRLGEKSDAMKESTHKALSDFSKVFTRQINTIYQNNQLQSLPPQSWPGIICQPFVFGEGQVVWSGADELKDKINELLQDQRGRALQVTRIARIYDGNFIFLLKPDRLRFWLRSVALRDADEVLVDLRAHGF